MLKIKRSLGKQEAPEKVHRRSEEGHEDGWCNSRGSKSWSEVEVSSA